ncbi:polyprenyl synthetase family protein [Patescibacteria group bacterium]|nr:polyprenyl synthetase family protein [Patescibacteria group bacterium]
MQAKVYLKDYIKKTEPILNSFFKGQEKEASKISPITVEMTRIYRNFMGGKNIRGALTKLGYECFGGGNEKAILKTSLMVEIAHSFLLIHDDIMDKDILRRGEPTIHLQYEDIHQKRNFKREGSHYGLSMAIDMGDIGMILSHLLLVDSDFSDEIKTRVLKCFDKQILMTAFGQALDLTYEASQQLSEKDIFQIHHYKTANYTITGPLQYGALFAGASEKEIKKIEKYGLPVGIAFQLRDDELGLFADEKTLGKPIGSDVKENKNTILHLKALESAKGEDKDFIKYAYGNRKLTKKELKRVREITQKTGALDYSQKMARRLVERGKKYIPQITTNLEHQDTLSKMADFMIERES